MNIIGIIDGSALLASLVGVLIVLKGWRRNSLNSVTKGSLIFLFLLMFLHNLSNFLEWNGITSALDQIEDYLGIMLPFFWGGIMYVFLQSIATNQLRRERDKTQQYLDIVGVIIVSFDQKHRVTLINNKGCSVLGCSEREVLGRDWFENFVPEKERQRFRKALEDFTAGKAGPNAVVESKILTKSREERSIRWTYSVLRDGNNNITGTLGAGEDVTEARRIQESLLEIKAHERALIDTLPHSAWVKDIEGRFILVNRAFAKSCGYDFREIIGKTDLDIWPKDLAKKYRADDAAVIRTKEVKFTQEPIASSVGTQWVETFKSPIFDQKGNVIGTTGIALDITERKREEDILRQSEKRLRQIIDLVPHFIFAKNRQGRFILGNQAVAEAYGTTVENLLGKTDADFNSDQAEVEQFIKDDNDVIDSGRLKEIPEEKITDSKGKVRYLHTVKIPFRTSAGEDAILGVSTDITEGKRTQEELFNSREMLRLVLDTIPQRVFWKDRKSVYLGSNKPFAQDCGYADSEDLVGKTDYETASAATAENFRSDDLRVIETGQPKLNYEEAQISADGSTAWLYTSKVPLHDKDGRVIGVLGTYENITKHKQAEEALRQSEEKYRTIIETAMDAIFIADKQTGEIIDANKRADDLLGLAHDKIIGMNFTEIHPKGEAQIYSEKFFMHKFKLGEPWDRTVGFVYNRQKGKIPVQINAVEIELRGRRVNVGVFRDITELKIIEDALRKDKDGLEKSVLEKTEILGKTLKELDDAKRLSDIGALAATVAHELRNPLGVIKTAVYNIKQKMKDDSLTSHLSNIDKKIGESESIIRNLLSYAQIKAPTYEKINVLDALNECVENCRHKFPDIHVEVSLRHPSGRRTPIVEVNSVHLNEMFSNILDNAYQAFLDHRGKIGIDFYYDDPKGFCRVVFQDDGPGIDKEVLPNVFDPFFTTKARGTGLGLSICNQILGLYSGTIDIQSVKDKGTTVTLNLPIHKKG